MIAVQDWWAVWAVRGLAVAGVIKVLVWLAGPGVQSLALVVLLDAATTLVVVASLGYALVRGLVESQRRVLWRVRRKLILSYVFIGLIPVMLVGAFFTLAGTLALLSASSFLVRLSVDDLVEQAARAARQIAIDLEDRADGSLIDLSRHRQGLVSQHPETSLSVFQTKAEPRVPAVSAGPWSHEPPPVVWPLWLSAEGAFTGLVVFETTGEPQIVARAMVRAPEPSAEVVVVDLPLGAETRRRVLAATGVEMGRIGTTARPTATGVLAWVSLLPHTDWTTGQTEFLNLQTIVAPREVYRRMFGAESRFGDGGLASAFVLALAVIGSLFLVIEFTALVMGLALARSITGAVHELFEGTEHVRRGNFGHRIVVETRDQLGELADSFNAMTGSVKNLLQEAAEKKRLEEELRIARRIQMSLLPRDAIEMVGVSVAATCVPAREVGGDYYDFIRLGDRRLGILVADVSGKGTSAAFYMAELKGLILSLSQIHESPRRLLVEVNRLIAPHIDSRSFITMMYVVLDLEQMTLTYARAGHTPLIYVCGASVTATAQVLAPSGLVVGLDGFQERFDELIEEDALEVGPGDVAVLFTDGVSEAMNTESDLFGEDRLGALVERHARLSAGALRTCIVESVTTFVGEADQHDDMTLVLFKIDDR